MTATPCDVCHRIHRGRCVPADKRTANLCVTVPGHVARRLRDEVPWGERSGWVAGLIERELEESE